LKTAKADVKFNLFFHFIKKWALGLYDLQLKLVLTVNGQQLKLIFVFTSFIHNRRLDALCEQLKLISH